MTTRLLVQLPFPRCQTCSPLDLLGIRALPNTHHPSSFEFPEVADDENIAPNLADTPSKRNLVASTPTKLRKSFTPTRKSPRLAARTSSPFKAVDVTKSSKPRDSIAPFFEGMKGTEEGLEKDVPRDASFSMILEESPAQNRKLSKPRDSIAHFFSNLEDEQGENVGDESGYSIPMEDSPSISREFKSNKPRDSIAPFFQGLREDASLESPSILRDSTEANDELKADSDMRRRDSTAAFFKFADNVDEDVGDHVPESANDRCLTGASQESVNFEQSMDLGAEDSFMASNGLVTEGSDSEGGKKVFNGDFTIDMEMDITTTTIPSAPEQQGEISLVAFAGDDDEDDEDGMQLDTFHGKDFERLRNKASAQNANVSGRNGPFSLSKKDLDGTSFDLQLDDTSNKREKDTEEVAPSAPYTHQLTPRKPPAKSIKLSAGSSSSRSIRAYGSKCLPCKAILTSDPNR